MVSQQSNWQHDCYQFFLLLVTCCDSIFYDMNYSINSYAVTNKKTFHIPNRIQTTKLILQHQISKTISIAVKMVMTETRFRLL